MAILLFYIVKATIIAFFVLDVFDCEFMQQFDTTCPINFGAWLLFGIFDGIFTAIAISMFFSDNDSKGNERNKKV